MNSSYFWSRAESRRRRGAIEDNAASHGALDGAHDRINTPMPPLTTERNGRFGAASHADNT
jgi:hypothetical protein